MKDIYNFKHEVDNPPILKCNITGQSIFIGDTIKIREDLYGMDKFHESVYILWNVRVSTYHDVQKINHIEYEYSAKDLKIIIYDINNDDLCFFYPKVEIDKYYSFKHCRALLLEKLKNNKCLLYGY